MDGTPLLDVFPSLVEGPDGALRSVRVLVVDDQLLIYENTPDGVVLVQQVPVVGFGQEQARGFGPWLLEGADGTTWRVIRSGGCGCGNRVKAMSKAALLALGPA